MIIDEAHSGQSGSAHDNMNRAMGAGDQDPDEDDPQDRILAAMQSRKMRGNASYFAFTATPKNTTLEKFGERQADGSFKPFHLYSMKQAIEEGFILNVLANYTTYKSYYEIQKSIADNPLFDTKKAQKKLRAYVERSQQTINTKAEIMLDHFIEHVVTPKKLRGKAKGMIVTQNIEAAIRYYKAVTKLLAERGNPFKALIAFSGEKVVDGVTYTEAEMNGFPEADTRDRFDEDDYRLLVVANKYLTGFDQPKSDHDVCGQEAAVRSRCAGAVTAEPFGPETRQTDRGPVHPRLLQRRDRHQGGLRPLLHRHHPFIRNGCERPSRTEGIA